MRVFSLLSNLKDIQLPISGPFGLFGGTNSVPSAILPKVNVMRQISQNAIDHPIRTVLREDIIRHSLFIGGSMRSAEKLYDGSSKAFAAALQEIDLILDPIDVGFLLLFIALYKPFLKLMYWLAHWHIPESTRKGYADSFFGHLEQPLSYHVRFLPMLYIIDVLNIVFGTLGLTKLTKWNIFTVFHAVFWGFIVGSYASRIKDYLVTQVIRPSFARANINLINDAQQKTVDELTSLMLWGIVAFINLEHLSKKLGFGLGSLFALGGIGSASIVLALRSTFENFSGGVVLKLQDKFRVGDLITVKNKDTYEGVVTEITYLHTNIRRADESVVAIPNHFFTQGELVNWNRASFKKFTTTTNVPLSQVTNLPNLINAIKDGLTQMPKIETKERDLLVSATNFDNGKITIKVDCYFDVHNLKEAGLVQTDAIGVIARAAQQNA